MNLEELYPDFEFLNSLNGTKYLIKGNHDYWFDTLSKINNFISQNNFKNIKMIHNTCEIIDNVAICGTRGWLFTEEQSSSHDKKIYKREIGRLEISLKAAALKNPDKIIAMLHYPPIYDGNTCDEIIELLSKYNVDICIYGHLHSDALKKAFEGNINKVEYKLVSADYLNFMPIKIL
jgi:predicted phosphohydrolase